MCGIFGEFLFKGNFVLENYINRLNLLQHRGPDGFGFEYGNFHEAEYSIYHNIYIIDQNEKPYVKVNYFMGHRRLSIMDLSTSASQPFESIDKRFSIVFNGEIYNYIEIKEELLKEECLFKTDHSDTEVLLNAYSKWGPRCLEKLRGMFAFAILDRQSHTVFLARDRIGQKPLYYELSDERFTFSSELTPMLRFVNTSRRINQEALCFYVVFGYVPHPISIFEDIHKLPPATCAFVDLQTNSITMNKYWDLDIIENQQGKVEQFVKETEDMLTESISLRLRADVPVGAFISGGTDSTLVVKKMKEIGRTKFDIFGADFPQPERSERKYIEEVASRYSQNLSLSNIDIMHVENIEDIINVFDEPFDGGSSIAIFDLFKVASEKKYKVILTGDGGDEMFAGYTRYAEFPPKHIIFRILNRLRFPGIILSLLESCGIKNRRLKKLGKFIKGDFISNYLQFLSNFGLLQLVKGEYQVDPEQFSLFKEIRENIKKYRLSPVKALQYLEVNTILPGRMLYKLDRFSMFYGVEARSPFLDHKLVEKAFIIPERFNVNKKTTKIIPKKILEQDFSKEFVYREKQGFGNPLSYWFEKSPSEQIFGVLINQDSEIFKYLDYDKLHEYFPQIKFGYDGTGERELWRFLVLGHYLENIKDVISC